MSLSEIYPDPCNTNDHCKRQSCNTAARTCNCQSDNDCWDGEYCGLAFVAGTNMNTFIKLLEGVGIVNACGNITGYYAPHIVCSLANFGIF